jgi:hypothetical protein
LLSGFKRAAHAQYACEFTFVLEGLAQSLNLPVEPLAEKLWQNTLDVFPLAKTNML